MSFGTEGLRSVDPEWFASGVFLYFLFLISCCGPLGLLQFLPHLTVEQGETDNLTPIEFCILHFLCDLECVSCLELLFH